MTDASGNATELITWYFVRTHSVAVCVSVSRYLPAAQCGGYHPVHPWNVSNTGARSTEAALSVLAASGNTVSATAPAICRCGLPICHERQSRRGLAGDRAPHAAVERWGSDRRDGPCPLRVTSGRVRCS